MIKLLFKIFLWINASSPSIIVIYFPLAERTPSARLRKGPQFVSCLYNIILSSFFWNSSITSVELSVEQSSIKIISKFFIDWFCILLIHLWIQWAWLCRVTMTDISGLSLFLNPELSTSVLSELILRNSCISSSVILCKVFSKSAIFLETPGLFLLITGN